MNLSHLRVSTFILLALTFLIISCDEVHLEFDKMEHTAFPQPQTVDPNRTVSLRSIFVNEALVNFIVDEDDTSIPFLAGADEETDPEGVGITDSELDNFALAHRDTPVSPSMFGTYYIYGAVVDYYREVDEELITTDAGLMWKTEDRSAFALFYKKINQSKPEKYLVAAAHEIGHTFNLHHADGKTIGTKKTIMYVPVATVGNDRLYKFSAMSRDHLLNHPEACRRPGTGWFGAIHEDHPNHGDTLICKKCDAQSLDECLN